MSKKSFFVMLVLSIVLTYVIALLDFGLNISQGSIGLPFGFSSFSFLGSSTDYGKLLLDIIFWFVAVWIMWRLLYRVFKR